MKAMPIRLVMGLIFAGIVWWTSVTSESELSMFYYFVIVTVFIIHQVDSITFILYNDYCYLSLNADTNLFNVCRYNGFSCTHQ